MRRITFSLLALCTLLLAPLSAQEVAKDVKKAAVKSHLKQHFKPYGFIRNYFAYDSRESMSGTGDLYYFQPYDVNYNVTPEEAAATGVKREDLNAVSSFRFLSITTRLGLDIVGYRWRNTEFGAKVEVDFYAALTGTVHKANGTALLRLRQAYLTLAWDSLRMNDKDYARVDLLLGQAWHPMAADLSDVIALNSGAPFGPFSRTPMVKMDARLGKYITLTGAALWQMQYMSNGPLGPSTQYINRSYTPEVYAGAAYSTHGVTLKAGVDILSICPRKTGQVVSSDGTPIDVRVNDRLTTVSPFFFAEYCHGMLHLAGKTIFAQSGEHLSLGGGYGVAEQLTDGSRRYTPTRTSATWLSVSYGKKVRGSLLAGYSKALGTKDTLQGPLYFCGNSFPNINSLWRLQPSITWTIGKYFVLGAEYELTSAQYGTYGTTDTHALATQDLHWVRNHRVQLMTMLKF